MTARIIPVSLFDLVVFGATGDLAFRKLLPALYYRDRDGQIPDGSRILGVSRRCMPLETYLEEVEATLRHQVPQGYLDPGCLARFLGRIRYYVCEIGQPDTLRPLAAALADGGDRVRVFYFATSPDLFGQASRDVDALGLVTDKSRVVLEKPIGHDLVSANAVNNEVGAVFGENQIFRIDHYLGKETVQNLMALRFANFLFEPLWNAAHIDHVQISVAETIGAEGRGDYYDRAGAMRDMVQNHILQLLCLVAMEPPTRFEPDFVRDEKLKVLRALKPITVADSVTRTVRGQYRAGAINGSPAASYPDEVGVPHSDTETFVALKVEVETWRWSGVPFFLRTGKRMPVRATEIVIQFRTIPHSIFLPSAGPISANKLIVRLQPDEGMRLSLMVKDPGPGGMRLRQDSLNLSFAETFRMRYPDAYERLLMDVVRGNPTLFMRRDEVEAAWRWVDPIIAAWQERGDSPRPYTAGSWGPSASVGLIVRDSRTWHEDGQ